MVRVMYVKKTSMVCWIFGKKTSTACEMSEKTSMVRGMFVKKTLMVCEMSVNSSVVRLRVSMIVLYGFAGAQHHLLLQPNSGGSDELRRV